RSLDGAAEIESHRAHRNGHGAATTQARQSWPTDSPRAAADAGDRAGPGVRAGAHGRGHALTTRLAQRHLSSALRRTLAGKVLQFRWHERQVRRFAYGEADLQLEHVRRNGALVS